MLTVYTVTYNEEKLIEFFVAFYRRRFPGCEIVVFDNFSTDRTVELAAACGCRVEKFDTGNRLSDETHANIKNNCWKNSKTPWVLVCDCDEMLDIYENQLKAEENLGTTVIKTQGFNMIDLNLGDVFDLEAISFGFPEKLYDKYLLFDRRKIREIRYGAGAHDAFPVGDVRVSNSSYRLLHYKFVSESYFIDKCKTKGSRLSDKNKAMGWGTDNLYSEEKYRQLYRMFRTQAVQILN